MAKEIPYPTWNETRAVAYVMNVILDETRKWINAQLGAERVRFTKVRAVKPFTVRFKAFDSGLKRHTIIDWEQPLMNYAGWGDNAEWFLYGIECSLCERYGLERKGLVEHLISVGLMVAKK